MHIYTDGSCKKDLSGGYGIMIDHDSNMKGSQTEIYGGFVSTTNNRMEMFAAIRALEIIHIAFEEKEIELEPIKIFSDSNLLCQGVSEWLLKWRKNDWKGSNGNKIKNQDLWIRLDLAMQKIKEKVELEFIWVKGHSDNEGNIIVDSLANLGASNAKVLRKDFESFVYEIA